MIKKKITVSKNEASNPDTVRLTDEFFREISQVYPTKYGVRSARKSILRFLFLGNISSLSKLFFESLSVVFVASVPCLRVAVSHVPSYCCLRGTAGFSSWCRYGLVSSLRVVASFLCLRVVGSSFRRLRYILDSGSRHVSTCFHISNGPLPFHLHLHEISKFLNSET